MNLIEQSGEYQITWDPGKDVTHETLIANLGGYEAAKSKFRDNGSFHAERMKRLLLQYRRQHNIYEVGDLVVMADADDYDTIFKVIGKPKHLYHLQGNDDLFYGRLDFQIRHATDAEIEAGKRLEVTA